MSRIIPFDLKPNVEAKAFRKYLDFKGLACEPGDAFEKALDHHLSSFQESAAKTEFRAKMKAILLGD